MLAHGGLSPLEGESLCFSSCGLFAALDVPAFGYEEGSGAVVARVGEPLFQLVRAVADFEEKSLCFSYFKNSGAVLARVKRVEAECEW